MKKLLITAALVLVTQIGLAQDAFKADVMKVIQASGASGPMQMAKEQIMQNIPLAKKADFSKDFDESLPALYDKLAKIYMEAYTHAEVKEMLKFYESPIGKKISNSTGEIYKKSTQAGEEWGMELQSKLMKYFSE
ncbi:DUF2059 domain-containing protein [Flavobacterium sp.]|uniref:DUF2059 domain-containing protein n=1 Tax=Flavobacterium sp. TaxID=239 RepID=UPI00260184BF|nr:DUF2059 domain-containing protein [Flavobacterium sp.]MDD3005499.1 DUF2059 domain-containing protein [Flavobacterium sp.]